LEASSPWVSGLVLEEGSCCSDMDASGTAVTVAGRIGGPRSRSETPRQALGRRAVP
jgi:hypothetical protein